jgi:hypothetical protein
MGIFRDTDAQEADIVKEMAEALGGTGVRLEEQLEKLSAAAAEVHELAVLLEGLPPSARGETLAAVNRSIDEHNALVAKAEDTLRWLLIQREACGFRTHRNVDEFYPIPRRIKRLEP